MSAEYPETEIEVINLADQSPWDETVARIAGWAADPDRRALEALRAMLTWRAADTRAKHLVPRLVSRALLARGPEGVNVIAEMIPRAPNSTYKQVLIEALWRASRGQDDPMTLAIAANATALTQTIDATTRAAADVALRNLLAESLVNDDLLSSVVGVLWTVDRVGGEGEIRGLLDYITEASIKLTPSLIEEFTALIRAEEREETYQRFLASHPVFLDPLAAAVVPKQRLGLEHATDYALRRHDERWLLVEIEKPQDRIVTGRNDLTAEFVHAFGQLLDFQRWVEAHGEYARHLMPGIASPRGLLIIGLRSRLDEAGRDKLRRFAANSATIEVLTFDDVLANARTLYRSLHHGRPPPSPAS